MKLEDVQEAARLDARLTNLRKALKVLHEPDNLGDTVSLSYAHKNLVMFKVGRHRFQELLEEEICTLQDAMKALGVKMEVEDAS